MEQNAAGHVNREDTSAQVGDPEQFGLVAHSDDAAEGREAVIGDIVRSIESLRSRQEGRRLAGVGIGVPGFILIEKGFIVGSNNLPYLEDFPVRDEIE